jgi:cation transport regulator ChaC
MPYADRVSEPPLWIFGYGSLVWRPAFTHRRALPAHLHGWVRRFWQGSTDHRGIPSRPGRVVTLLEESAPHVVAEKSGAATEGPCWGCAYEVEPTERDAVLATLDHRERGGYRRVDVDLTLQVEKTRQERVSGLVYIAEATNQNYLGPAPIESIARQIVSARGPSGANPEYVYELARSLRAMGAVDRHVFGVENAVSRLSSFQEASFREASALEVTDSEPADARAADSGAASGRGGAEEPEADGASS